MEISERYDRDDLLCAVEVLRQGGVIVYPTDTVWGIGCDARSEAAVKRIYEIKRRADSKSMLCLLDGAGKLQGYVREVPSAAFDLLEVADKPLTIIYPDAKNVAPNLIAQDGSIGIRITAEPFSKALCERLHAPVVSTSANRSGEATPLNFSQIKPDLLEEVDYVVRYRRKDKSQPRPSSILKIDKGNVIKIIRQ